MLHLQHLYDSNTMLRIVSFRKEYLAKNKVVHPALLRSNWSKPSVQLAAVNPVSIVVP